jgi:uncharacterized surface protein with fasciclin (FAS1) repeats
MKKTLLQTIAIAGLTAAAFSTSFAASSTFDTNLGQGMRGERVTAIQNFLADKGYLSASSRGYFGPATKAALIKFQTANGIHGTGFLGSMTRDKINMLKGTAVAQKDIVDTAVATPVLSTLVAAVKAASLVDTLKGAGPFTVFAPTNDAFAKLPAGTVASLLTPEKKSDLTSVLTYHVVAGSYTADKVTDGLVLKTVNGKDLRFTLRDGKVIINGNSTVVLANVATSNGVVHVIDTVLLP